MKAAALENTAPKEKKQKIDKKLTSVHTHQKQERGQSVIQTERPDLGEGGERVYVLPSMFFTAPTFHLERSPLKSTALINTAPQEQTEIQRSKGVDKTEERNNSDQNYNISAHHNTCT